MDDIDRKIIRTMQAEPALPLQALADRVGLSHTPCWRRLKKLESERIILGRALLLDQERVGLPITVFAHLKIRHHDEETLEAFESAVTREASILECFSVSGRSDFICRVVAESIASYEVFLKKVLLHLPGVAEVNSEFALKRVKVTTELPV